MRQREMTINLFLRLNFLEISGGRWFLPSLLMKGHRPPTTGDYDWAEVEGKIEEAEGTYDLGYYSQAILILKKDGYWWLNGEKLNEGKDRWIQYT